MIGWNLRKPWRIECNLSFRQVGFGIWLTDISDGWCLVVQLANLNLVFMHSAEVHHFFRPLDPNAQQAQNRSAS
jgi:hypothetical protein